MHNGTRRCAIIVDRLTIYHQPKVEIMKLRLFALRNIRTNKLVPELYFNSKPEAKRKRDAINEEAKTNVYVVTVGPDHDRFRIGQPNR